MCAREPGVSDLGGRDDLRPVPQLAVLLDAGGGRARGRSALDRARGANAGALDLRSSGSGGCGLLCSHQRLGMGALRAGDARHDLGGRGVDERDDLGLRTGAGTVSARVVENARGTRFGRRISGFGGDGSRGLGQGRARANGTRTPLGCCGGAMVVGSHDLTAGGAHCEPGSVLPGVDRRRRAGDGSGRQALRSS